MQQQTNCTTYLKAMCAKSNLSRMRGLVALLMMAAACGLLARADDTSVPAARVTSPELEKMLQSSERLRDAVNAQVKLLEEQYVKQRKLSTDVSLDPDARAGATKEAAKLSELLKSMTKERDALTTQLETLRRTLGLPPTDKKPETGANGGGKGAE